MAVIRGDHWWRGTDGLVVEYGEDAFSSGTRKLDNVMSPRLFAMKYRPAQVVKVFALDEALGEGA